MNEQDKAEIAEKVVKQIYSHCPITNDAIAVSLLVIDMIKTQCSRQ
jgi:hypothetical protein